MKTKTLIMLFLTSILLQSCWVVDKKQNEKHSIKPQWITEAFQLLQQNNYPQLSAVSWWHENWVEESGEKITLRIDSSPESLQAYRDAVASSFFTTDLQFVNNKLVPPATGMYLSAFPDFGGPEDDVRTQKITDFENLAQKQIGWAYFSDNWYNNIHFPVNSVEYIHQSGKTPFVRMMARTNLDENVADSQYSMQRIIDGDFDADLIQWFIDAAQIGYPLLIEFGTEMNGSWFPWNGVHNGGSNTTDYGDPNLADGPERFRDAYRHIIDLSRQAGATNLTWFFHVDAPGLPYDNWNKIENYYPGDNYIDWIGISAYGALDQNELFSLGEKLNMIYGQIVNLSNKPVALLETAILEFQVYDE
jgi:hypothetical protein